MIELLVDLTYNRQTAVVPPKFCRIFLKLNQYCSFQQSLWKNPQKTKSEEGATGIPQQNLLKSNVTLLNRPTFSVFFLANDL